MAKRSSRKRLKQAKIVVLDPLDVHALRNVLLRQLKRLSRRLACREVDGKTIEASAKEAGNAERVSIDTLDPHVVGSSARDLRPARKLVGAAVEQLLRLFLLDRLDIDPHLDVGGARRAAKYRLQRHLARYGPNRQLAGDHPDVVRLTSRLEALERERGEARDVEEANAAKVFVACRDVGVDARGVDANIDVVEEAGLIVQDDELPPPASRSVRRPVRRRDA